MGIHKYFAEDCMRMLHILHVLGVIDQRTAVRSGASVWSRIRIDYLQSSFYIKG